MNLKKRVFFIVFFIYFVGGLWSLDPQKIITQYTLDTWKTERGLPNNTVLAIAQGRSGYLWLGTVEGLVRFDGINFSIFNSNNTPEFHDNFVNNLFFDRREVLWIGTYRGKLLSLENGKFQNHPLSQKVAGISFNCLAEDGQGNLWVGTSEGLFYRSPGNNGPFKKDLVFPGIGIHCLTKDRSGRIVVSTVNKGLYRLEKEQWHRILSASDKLGCDIGAISQDRDGFLWFGTDDGLYSYRDNKLRHFLLKPGLSNNITALIEDHDGNLWVVSEGGLIRWQNDDFQFLNKVQGMDSKYISSLCEDAEGSLWVGAFDGGLTQIRDEKITTITGREGLNGEVFRSVHGDDSGALWIVGYGGYLNRYQNNRVENFILPVRFRSETIWSLETDAKDSFWLGTSSGLLHFQDGSFKKITLPGATANIETRCVLKDSSGRLWIGTYGAGLFCWQQQGTFKRYFHADDPDYDRITSLFEDRRRNLWVGCENGLAVMALEKPGQFIREQFLDNCHVVSFYEDLRGTIWVGTRNQGLKVFENGRWGSLNSDRGLFDNRVYAILEDDVGYLWLSSERGIFRAKKSELERAAFDKNLKVSGRVFDENDGMKSRICNSGNPAAWKDGSGRLWFANLAGVVSIDPARIRKNDQVPPVLVEAVVVDNRSLPASGTSITVPLRLPAGSLRFEFHYTALSFIRSAKIEFKYKLEGYDRDWTSAGNRREAIYNNLNPGPYRFRVIAANADGVWNMAGAAFAFYLRPFVYQTWWFMALAVLAFAVFSALSWQLLKRYLHAVSFWKKRT
ncbi:MAG: triple tyrosine motif-containing protein, partial [Candidatus Aminicenantes bacterium]|nr:triple tyrosine motif-containing protein [Candidatus Aminicenantes bacterium]